MGILRNNLVDALPYAYYVILFSLRGDNVLHSTPYESNSTTISTTAKTCKQKKQTIPWWSGSRSERCILQRRCQRKPTPPGCVGESRLPYVVV